jgi:CubicO group peptidase (beta-lactamase class C family)
MIKNLILSLTALAGLPAVAVGADLGTDVQTRPHAQFESVQARLQTQFEALVEDGFTGAVIVAFQGEIIWSEAAGLADPAQGRPIDLHTQFDIASITKTLTGMVAADLIEQGVLAPDTRFGDVFEDAPAPFDGLTVHQLLTHSAGLVDGVGDDAEAIDAETQRARLYQTELRFEPGEGYGYSNLGYSLVAQMLEALTGQDYEALLSSYLARAGLTATGYAEAADRDQMIIFEDGQALDDASWGGHPPGWNLIGNGGLASSAHELMAWRLAYAAGELTTPDAVARAHQPYQAEDEVGRSYYGYGLVVEDHAERGRIYWHNGGSRRFNSHWRSYADEGLTLVALSNQWEVTADRVEQRLSAAWFEAR